MKAFRFSLEALLKVRRQEVRRAQRGLFAKRSEWETLKREESQLYTSREGTAGILRGEIEYAQQVRALLKKKGAELLAEQKSVGEAIKQRKIVEKLREKQYSQWLAQRNREEITFLDEIAKAHSPTF